MRKELPKITEREMEALSEYKKVLKDYSLTTNVISKKITEDQLDDLLRESLLVEKLIVEHHVVDAGSGNGLLGIPVALLNPQKKIYLVEPRKKKSEFLSYIKEELNLKNVEVMRMGIEEFVKSRDLKKNAIIARGFPNNDKLISYVKNGIAGAVYLVTSINKIKKLRKGIEKVGQNIYNVPFRDNLKIVSTINVSRETQGENG